MIYSFRTEGKPVGEGPRGAYGAAELRRAGMRGKTVERGFVCCMARLESAPRTREKLALRDALVALRGSNGFATRLPWAGESLQTKSAGKPGSGEAVKPGA